MSISPWSINSINDRRSLSSSPAAIRTSVARGQFPIALVVVGLQRLLEPEDAVVGECARSLDGGLRVPDQARVDHQVRVVAQAFTRLANQRDVVLLVLPHRCPAELHRREAPVAETARAQSGFFRRGSEQRTGVGANLARLKSAAEQFPHRLPERLALDVPERQVDAAHSVDRDASPAGVDVLAVHLVPEYSVSRGSSPISSSRNPVVIVCENGPSMHALHRQRRRIDLADAGDPGVGAHFHDQRVLAAVALLLHLGLAQIDGFDVDDFHGCCHHSRSMNSFA